MQGGIRPPILTSTSLQVVIRYDPCRGPITALTVTREECILAGTQDGTLLVFAPDPRRTLSRRLDLAETKPSRAGGAREAAATIRYEA